MNTKVRGENPPQVVLTKNLPFPAVRELYLAAGWLAPDDDAAFLTPMLQNSFRVAAAFDGDRLVGLMRALSDGVSDAYLLDLVVAVPYRRRGVARALLRTLSDHLTSLGIDWIVCVGAPGTEEFYARTGARKMEHHTPYRLNGPVL